MDEPRKPERRDINTGGGNYNERIDGDYIEINVTGRQEQAPLTPQEYRNRQALLTKVKNFWVRGVLEKSLYNQVLIELGLEERPDAVINPWNAILETGDDSPQTLPEGTKIIDVFDNIGTGRTLLILGEPGSGKTTTLLELTRDLIARAEQDVNQLIPLVFNLSSWANKRQNIEDWLVAELGNKYDVPKAIRKSLIKKQQLLPLLDGLDEVKAEYRDDCIIAINQFKQDYGAELVVCCRIKDYQALSNSLNFQSAICVKLLSLEQIVNYLNIFGDKLTCLRTLIAEDEVWQELAQSPLMLNIMALTYQGVAIEYLPKTGLVEARRQNIFDSYIEQVFNRRKANQLYKKQQVIHWLIWLGKRIVQESQTLFLIERMQPNWLDSRKPKKIYNLIIILILSPIYGLFFSLMIRLCLVVFLGRSLGLFLDGSLGLFLGGFVVLSRDINEMKIITVEKLKFRFREVTITNIILNLSSGLALGFFSVINQINHPNFSVIKVLIVGLTIGLIDILTSWLINVIMNGWKNISTIEIKTSPNQGIWSSVYNTITLVLIFAPTFGMYLWLTFELIFVPFLWLVFGLIIDVTEMFISWLSITLSMSLLVGLLYGGLACIQHFTLRLILYFNNYIPWNYARFLDYAADRILLQKVGGGYIFIHRMLMEHFANMNLEEGNIKTSG